VKLLWSNLAEDSLLSIYREVAGIRIARKIRTEILVATNQLKRFPDSGQEEELLKQLDEGHRYLVIGHHKIIYKPVDKGILITDVFDTRQNPIKMNNPERK
jgi:toxin ParE1/3/4